MPRWFEGHDTATLATACLAFLQWRPEHDTTKQQAVAEILHAVRQEGDAALLTYTKRFDGWQPAHAEALRVSGAACRAALDGVPSAIVDSLKQAIARVRDYHTRQMPLPFDYTDAVGNRLMQVWRPLHRVGLYVPGGLAAYPSSLIMNAVPAQTAGVAELVVAVPAPQGNVSPLVLATAALLGIEEIYRVGGAQAIGALAFGTPTMRAVDKIVGPGNAYVAIAKQQVYGTVGIDMIAGPSEILVIADGTVPAAWVAADLLSQAEHDETARAILIATDRHYAEAICSAVAVHLQSLPRAAIAGHSWEHYGMVAVVPDIPTALALANAIAPEHLELAVAEPMQWVPHVRHAGAIFAGPYTPEAIGDYIAGPSHVLPTAGCARYASGLGVYDFLKRMAVVACTPEGFAAIGPAAATLAHAEGLDAHALSVAIRRNGSI
jgi:histidinol dehydrogenase